MFADIQNSRINYVRGGQRISQAEFLNQMQQHYPTEAEVDAIVAETDRLLVDKPHTPNPNRKGSAMTMTGHEERYREEYSQHLNIHQQLGISVEEYIDQRMIEDGHKADPIATLQTGTAPPPSGQQTATAPGLIDLNDPDWNE